MKAMDFAMQHCYERASIVTDKELLRHALRFGVGDVDVEQIKRQLLRDELLRKTWTVGNGSPPRTCWRKKNG